MTTGPRSPGARPGPPPLVPLVPERPVALVDLLDRLLAGGVVVAGEITLSVAEVDLVRISLRAMIASVRAAVRADAGTALPPAGADAGTPTGPSDLPPAEGEPL